MKRYVVVMVSCTSLLMNAAQPPLTLGQQGLLPLKSAMRKPGTPATTAKQTVSFGADSNATFDPQSPTKDSIQKLSSPQQSSIVKVPPVAQAPGTSGSSALTELRKMGYENDPKILQGIKNLGNAGHQVIETVLRNNPSGADHDVVKLVQSELDNATVAKTYGVADTDIVKAAKSGHDGLSKLARNYELTDKAVAALKERGIALDDPAIHNRTYA